MPKRTRKKPGNVTEVKKPQPRKKLPGELEGPLKASDEIIAKARKRKSPPGDPVPDDFFMSEEEDKKQVILKYLNKVNNPKSAMRAMCALCMGGYLGEIAKCTNSRESQEPNGELWCPLHEFRMGNNPYHSRSAKSKKDDGNG